MSQITIDARDARLAVLGYQPEIKRIYWSALPSTLPTYGETLDLSGCEITAIYADGSESVVTPYCTFSPDTGYTVPNANTLTVTATYTARSGKVCEADETLPICALDHIKIIIPRSVPDDIKEQCQQYHGNTPTMSDYARAFGFSDVYVAAYWSQGGEIVRITRLDTDSVLSSSCCSYDANEYIPTVSFIVANTYSAIFDRYYTPTEYRHVLCSHAFKLQASYTLNGQTYTDAAYLSADICIGYELRNPPLAYSGTQTVTLDSRDTSQWKLIYSETGDQPLELMSPYLGEEYQSTACGPHFFITPYPQTYVERIADDVFQVAPSCLALTITLEDGAEGTFNKPQQVEPISISDKVDIKFKCDNGAVTWTYTPHRLS